MVIAAWCAGGAVLVIHSAPREGAPGLSPPERAALHRPPTDYADGAPPGFSGGFAEQSCDGCHFQNEPNTRPGEVSLSGVPERFVGGEQYPLAVTLTRPGMKLGGFQLAARFEDGTQAGRLERAPGEEKRLAVETQGDVHYANQRRPGAELTGPDTVKWTLVWTAPMATRPVTFHVAANAADNDESTRGDYVYTTTAQSTPR
jgi:hypothetical protein